MLPNKDVPLNLSLRRLHVSVDKAPTNQLATPRGFSQQKKDSVSAVKDLAAHSEFPLLVVLMLLLGNQDT